jgi:hypothetical protein
LTTTEAQQNDGSQWSIERLLAVSIVLPVGLLGLAAAARLIVRSEWCSFFDLSTLGGVGLLGYIAGSWTLLRGLQRARARWLLTLVLYDLAMPLLIFGLVLLADSGVPCR